MGRFKLVGHASATDGKAEAVERVVQLRREGHSCGQIAVMLGVSRQAVHQVQQRAGVTQETLSGAWAHRQRDLILRGHFDYERRTVEAYQFGMVDADGTRYSPVEVDAIMREAA